MFKKRNIRNIFIYLFIILVSYSFSDIEILGNNFIFIIPWIIFCFLNNKWYGYLSWVFSFLFLGVNNSWFYLLMIGFLSSFFVFKYVLNLFKSKMKILLNIYNFIVVFSCSLLTLLIKDEGNVISCFLLSVGSYWIMRCFYELYFCINNDSEITMFPYKITVFLLFAFGAFVYSLDLSVSVINISLIFLVFLAFIAGKIGVEEGVMYTFLMFLFMILINKSIGIDVVLFLGTFLISSLLNRVSKGMLFFTYMLANFLFVYYLGLDYLICVNYCIGGLLYLLIPSFIYDQFIALCEGSEKFYNRISEDSRKFNLEMANKIIKMEEVFSLTCNKINVKGRLKKCDRLLLSEEVGVFSELLNGFSSDIKENYNKNYYKVEKEIYKYGFDLLDFKVNHNIFKDVVVRGCVRCDKNDISKIVVPLICKNMRKNFKIENLEYNDIFGYYKFVLKEKKNRDFKFGVAQKARDGEICGDSYLVYENDDKKIFIISDGMGSGSKAKERSKLALDIFKKFIDIGFDIEHSIASLNCILKNEYSKDTYTTLDVFVYDKYKDEFYFYKNGASNSYVFGKDVVIVEGNDLPLGIVEKVDFKMNKVNIDDGDYVIMISDGIDEECLNNLKNSDTMKVCNEVIGRQKEIIDDETVIVIKIKK